MLKYLMNRFRSKSSSRPQYESARLYKKDGNYHADPLNVEEIDKFESHKQLAAELNGYIRFMDKIRHDVIPLEGSELDLNERPDVVAVNDFAIDGKSVDVALRSHGEGANTSKRMNARVTDSRGSIEIEERDHLYTQYIDFETEARSIKVLNEKDESYVTVSINRH